MKVPPKRKGNPLRPSWCGWCRWFASMKVPPKRKGNPNPLNPRPRPPCLNESPSEKEGKFSANRRFSQIGQPSMKVPPKRKGNDFDLFVVGFGLFPSMKVPPKRKGNILARRLRTLPPPFPQ